MCGSDRTRRRIGRRTGRRMGRRESGRGSRCGSCRCRRARCQGWRRRRGRGLYRRSWRLRTGLRVRVLRWRCHGAARCSRLSLDLVQALECVEHFIATPTAHPAAGNFELILNHTERSTAGRATRGQCHRQIMPCGAGTDDPANCLTRWLRRAGPSSKSSRRPDRSLAASAMVRRQPSVHQPGAPKYRRAPKTHPAPRVHSTRAPAA